MSEPISRRMSVESDLIGSVTKADFSTMEQTEIDAKIVS
jgi:hypothetical protein